MSNVRPMRNDCSLTVEFVTERFDYHGDIPPDANAGNRFYGRDVAVFLCTGLRESDVAADFIEEDWGWLVLGRHKSQETLEIAVYHWGGVEPDDNEGATGTWRLRVSSWKERPFVYVFKRRMPHECSVELASKIRAVLEGGSCTITVFGQSND